MIQMAKKTTKVAQFPSCKPVRLQAVEIKGRSLFTCKGWREPADGIFSR